MSFESELVKDYLGSLSSEKKQELFKEILESLNEQEKQELAVLMLPLMVKELKELPDDLKEKIKSILD